MAPIPRGFFSPHTFFLGLSPYVSSSVGSEPAGLWPHSDNSTPAQPCLQLRSALAGDLTGAQQGSPQFQG